MRNCRLCIVEKNRSQGYTQKKRWRTEEQVSYGRESTCQWEWVKAASLLRKKAPIPALDWAALLFLFARELRDAPPLTFSMPRSGLHTLSTISINEQFELPGQQAQTWKINHIRNTTCINPTCTNNTMCLLCSYNSKVWPIWILGNKKYAGWRTLKHTSSWTIPRD